MFDRNVGGGSERSKVTVLLGLSTGETMTAQVAAYASGKLIDTINRAEPFIEVDLTDGSTRIISKQSILSITPLSAPKADELQRAQKSWTFDPVAVLGVAADATADEIRAAYMAQVKAYHPDRFVSLGLPMEVEAYAASMLQRINTAYQALNPRALEAA